jgi:hypothetical protein
VTICHFSANRENMLEQSVHSWVSNTDICEYEARVLCILRPYVSAVLSSCTLRADTVRLSRLHRLVDSSVVRIEL